MRIDVCPAVMPGGLNAVVTPEGIPVTLNPAIASKPLVEARLTEKLADCP